MIRFIASSCLALFCAATTLAQPPKPIKLTLTPAKLASPPLRYQLLPDARLTVSGDAAPIYMQVIELLAKKQTSQKAELFYAWSELPLERLPLEDVRKELADYEDVFELLDKAARCDRCEWGVLERLREKGIGALLPELQPMRQCGQLLSLRARLEISEGRFDKAVATLRTGLALARNTSAGETLINFLVGVAIASMMEGQLDQLISRPDAPNLYYALTDMPASLFTLRKGLQGERISTYATFPGLAKIASDLNAGSLSEKELKTYTKIVNGLSPNEVELGYFQRILMARNIQNRHEFAKKSLIEAGRPRDKVEAMPHLQVALLHALLEYDAVLDNMIVWESLPYWQFVGRVPKVDRLTLERLLDPDKPAIPLASLLTPSIERIAFARARNERKVALLRTIEALRLYAANHDGKLPPSLALVKEVPIPLDPVTGKDFEYRLEGETASLRAPPPGKVAANAANNVVYELRMRK